MIATTPLREREFAGGHPHRIIGRCVYCGAILNPNRRPLPLTCRAHNRLVRLDEFYGGAA